MLAFVEFSKPINDFCEATGYSFSDASHGFAGGSIRASPNNFSFTKDQDGMSNALMQYCAAGTRFAKVSVEFYLDAESDIYRMYTFSDVIIGAMSTSAGSDTVGLQSKSFRTTYFGG